MDWAGTINNAIAYIENHLTDDIALCDIAQSVNISAFHFHRAFSLLTGMTPAEYVRKRRLSLAGAEIAGGNAREIPAFWDEYFAREECRKIPGYLGVCAQKKTGGDVFRYGIGCKASDVDCVPEEFEIIHIPQYTWAVFKCVGPSPAAIQAMWEKIYKEWLPVAEYELILDYDIENYLPGDPASKDYVSEICIPVRSKK